MPNPSFFPFFNYPLKLSFSPLPYSANLRSEFILKSTFFVDVDGVKFVVNVDVGFDGELHGETF